MGITSENVAAKYKISRQAQDDFAAKSFQKAAEAQKNGWFKSEIVPVQVAKDGGAATTVDQDDGIRQGVTSESLAKLKPAFSKDGSTHAGNASQLPYPLFFSSSALMLFFFATGQVSDGAAAVLLMKRKTAKQLRLPVVGKFVTAVSAGVPPNIVRALDISTV